MANTAIAKEAVFQNLSYVLLLYFKSRLITKENKAEKQQLLIKHQRCLCHVTKVQYKITIIINTFWYTLKIITFEMNFPHVNSLPRDKVKV